MNIGFALKVHLNVIWSIWAKKFLNLVESSTFYALQSGAWCVSRPRFREPGAAVPDDVYPGTKHNGASVSSLYLLEKMETKLIVPLYFGTKTSKLCFRINFFSSLESELGFDSEDTEINFDRARSATVNSLLRVLRTICNISSDDGEDFFADELLVY